MRRIVRQPPADDEQLTVADIATPLPRPVTPVQKIKRQIKRPVGDDPKALSEKAELRRQAYEQRTGHEPKPLTVRPPQPYELQGPPPTFKQWRDYYITEHPSRAQIGTPEEYNAWLKQYWGQGIVAAEVAVMSDQTVEGFEARERQREARHLNAEMARYQLRVDELDSKPELTPYEVVERHRLRTAVDAYMERQPRDGEIEIPRGFKRDWYLRWLANKIEYDSKREAQRERWGRR